MSKLPYFIDDDEPFVHDQNLRDLFSAVINQAIKDHIYYLLRTHHGLKTFTTSAVFYPHLKSAKKWLLESKGENSMERYAGLVEIDPKYIIALVKRIDRNKNNSKYLYEILALIG